MYSRLAGNSQIRACTPQGTDVIGLLIDGSVKITRGVLNRSLPQRTKQESVNTALDLARL